MPLVCSCSDTDEVLTPGMDSAFRVGAKEISFLRSEGKTNLYIVAPSKPTLSSDQPWLTLSDPVLNGSSDMTYVTEVCVQANSSYDDRSATITITCGTESANVNVVQSTAEGLIINEVTPSKTVSADGGIVTVKLQATGEYSISLPNGVAINDSRSLTQSEVVLNVASNITSQEKTLDVVFTLKADNSISATVTLTQLPNEGLIGKTATQIASMMYNGINIGNTLEAIGGETAWGADKINRQYIKAMKNAGFNALRVPVSWSENMDANNVISQQWLDRVYEVVGYAIDEGMFVMINDHWDNGWLDDHYTEGYRQDLADKLYTMWVQVAQKMANYDQHLLMAGFNEPPIEKEAHLATLMQYQQVFVDAVRSTGGLNEDRILVLSGPSTDSEKTVNWAFDVPQDPSADRLMVEVHFYSPYQFVMMEEDADWSPTFWFWGEPNHKEGSTHNSTWGEEDYVHDNFAAMYNKFGVRGIPAIVGEYGSIIRSNLTGEDYDLHMESRRYWSRTVVKEAKNNGMVPFYWDTPNGLFRRSDGTILDQKMIDAVMLGANEGIYPY